MSIDPQVEIPTSHQQTLRLKSQPLINTQGNKFTETLISLNISQSYIYLSPPVSETAINVLSRLRLLPNKRKVFSLLK